MKIDRLLGIVYTLLQTEKVTAPYLAEKFEVSRRTINRDIDDLCKAGIPVITQQGAKGGISLSEEFVLDKALFNQKELTAIFTGLLSLNSVAQDQKYQGIIEKLSRNRRGVVNTNHMMIDLSSHYKDTLAPKIALIQECIESCTTIQFDYYNANGQKSVLLNPYLILFQWSSWYLLGSSPDTTDFKLYKLNRLWNPQETQQNFEAMNIPEEALAFDNYFTNEINAVILFERKVEHRLIEEYGPDSFAVLPDGKLRFEFPFTNPEYLLEWVLSFGENAQLLKPENLRTILKDRLQKTLNGYL